MCIALELLVSWTEICLQHGYLELWISVARLEGTQTVATLRNSIVYECIDKGGQSHVYMKAEKIKLHLYINVSRIFAQSESRTNCRVIPRAGWLVSVQRQFAMYSASSTALEMRS